MQGHNLWRSGDARDNIVTIEAPHGDDIGRVCGEQHGLIAQRCARCVHKVLEVRLVIEAAEAVLILNLHHRMQRIADCAIFRKCKNED